MRDEVFISYSHKDTEWAQKFSTHLKVIPTGCLTLWSDQQIESGQNWQDKIEKAIERARVALLLVTPDFFASEFIQNQELPKILKRHKEKGGLFLYCVPIRYGAYQKGLLADIQAASDPKKPLRDLSEAEQDRIMMEIVLDIVEKLGQSVRVAGDDRKRLKAEVEDRLKGRYEVLDEIDCGDTSIVFKGRQGLQECAVKVLVSRDVSSGERENLGALLNKAAQLTDSAFIRVHDIVLKDDPICIVSEYVKGRTLSHVLHQQHRLPPDEAISYVRQLARAFGEASRSFTR